MPGQRAEARVSVCGAVSTKNSNRLVAEVRRRDVARASLSRERGKRPRRTSSPSGGGSGSIDFIQEAHEIAVSRRGRCTQRAQQ